MVINNLISNQTLAQNASISTETLSTSFKHSFQAQKQLFYNEIKAHYNLREPKSSKPTMVFMVVYFDKKQVRISTGCKVYPKQWNKTKTITGATLSPIDNHNNSILNAKINELNVRYEEYKYYLCNGILELNINTLRSYMAECWINEESTISFNKFATTGICTKSREETLYI